MSQTTTDTHSTSAPRIGARLVVELLRMGLEEPLTDKISLSQQRTKPSLALLQDKLLQIQKTLSVAEVECTIESGLIERCSDQHIALPIAEPDWGAIGLIDRLFDTLLNEGGLDAEAAAWFGQLRLPVIRYALLDYSFFFAPQNLVRRFLNQAYIALLSSTEKSRKVNRAQLNQFSLRILKEFKDDVSQFNSICIEAQAWFASQNQKVEKIAEQLKNLESARRKEKVAEPRVVELLNRVAAGKQVPPELQQFLHGEWRRSLSLISMREGEQGATWKRQVRITESLLEFSLGCTDDNQRENYRSFYPVLMKNLKSLLVSLEDEEGLTLALDPLELVFTAMLNGAIPELETVPKIHLANSFVSSIEVSQVGQKSLDAVEALQEGQWLRMKTGDGSHELCRITLKGSLSETWVLVSQTGKTVAKKDSLQLAQALEGGVVELIEQSHYWDHGLNQHFQTQYEHWLELRKSQKTKQQSLAEPKQQSEPEQVPQPEIEVVESRTDEILKNSTLALVQPEQLEQEIAEELSGDGQSDQFLPQRTITDQELVVALQAVEQIQVGGWIVQETSEGEQRCKLAVKIRGHDKLVFVNRLGIKTLEIQREELARLVAYGAVTIVDTGKEFDNTLERVVRSIQDKK